jgi:hypothetical protein
MVDLAKWIIGYWLFGVALCGCGMGAHMERCPNDNLASAGEISSTAAVWPAFVVGALTGPRHITLPPCEPRP